MKRQDPDLCQGDLMSLMMGGTDILQDMCDTGCIPIVVLDACDTNAAAQDGSAGLFLASTGMCDFVNCCVVTVTEQEETGDAAAVVVSSTRTKFEECQESLPEMEDLLTITVFPLDDSANTTATSDFEGPFDMDFDMSDFQDTIEEIADGFQEVLNQFGDDMLSEMFANLFDSSSIPAFCADEMCNAPAGSGFCECFSGDLAQCNTEVISQACATDAFSTCAPGDFDLITSIIEPPTLVLRAQSKTL